MGRPAEEATPVPEHVLTKAFFRAAQILGLRGERLARVVGMSEASLSRHRNGKVYLSPESKEGELALLLVRIFRSLDALVGGDDAKSRAWLHAANDDLGGTPADRIETVEGLVDVLQYLDAMRGAS